MSTSFFLPFRLSVFASLSLGYFSFFLPLFPLCTQATVKLNCSMVTVATLQDKVTTMWLSGLL